MVRDPRRLEGRAWYSAVETVQADVFDPAALSAALDGVHAAYYLIHSMAGSSDFHERDLAAARNFSMAARQAGVQRILYLGGLGDPGSDLSRHLRSRQLTGEALREAGVPVTEFRAAVIVGSGSLSFEMVRYLTERVPIMVCPRWVFTRIQPIGITDVLSYLLSALRVPESAGRVIEIGGSQVLTYGEMMLGYARWRGLKRILLPVPVLTPRLSSFWVHWVTPIPAELARPLIEGLRNEVIVKTGSAAELFPDILPISYDMAVQRALEHVVAGDIETIWSDALSSSQGDRPAVYLTEGQGLILERRRKLVNASSSVVFRTFSGLGGERGWPALNFAWRLRGMLDRLIGGVGLRRGRRDPHELRVGDAVDFWRVEAVEENSILRLRAEMKVPGKAWLQFDSKGSENGKTELVQTAFFEPKGLWGWIYWYALYPVHAYIFARMVSEIARMAEASDGLLPGRDVVQSAE
jgi:uncharacterized protein YbjT (DUF2867 family)